MATGGEVVNPAKGKILAHLVRQLNQVRDEKKTCMHGFKEREENLQMAINSVAHDIETGQESLFDGPAEGEPNPVMNVAEKIADAIDGTVITLDSGATATITKEKPKGKNK